MKLQFCPSFGLSYVAVIDFPINPIRENCVRFFLVIYQRRRRRPHNFSMQFDFDRTICVRVPIYIILFHIEKWCPSRTLSFAFVTMYVLNLCYRFNLTTTDTLRRWGTGTKRRLLHRFLLHSHSSNRLMHIPHICSRIRSFIDWRVFLFFFLFIYHLLLYILRSPLFSIAVCGIRCRHTSNREYAAKNTWKMIYIIRICNTYIE